MILVKLVFLFNYFFSLNLESFRLDKDNILKLGDFLLSKGFDQEDDK